MGCNFTLHGTFPLKLLSFFHLRPPNFCFLAPSLAPSRSHSSFPAFVPHIWAPCVKPGGPNSRLAPPALSVGPEEAGRTCCAFIFPGPSSFNPASPHMRS